jgi:hypothetical protein
MKKLLPLILFCVVVFGCTNDDDAPDEPKLKTIFTFTGGGNYSETWIVLRDSETGELIDSKQVKTTAPVIFESDKNISNNKLSVSMVSVDVSGLVLAGVYNGIDVGAVWTYKPVFQNSIKGIGTHLGTYDFQVSDIPEISTYAFSDGINNLSDALSYDGSDLMGNVDLFDNTKTPVISIYPTTGKARYKFLKDLSDGDDIAISYNDMTPYDKFVNVKFPAGMAPIGNITIQDGSDYYTIYENSGFFNQSDDLTEINLGFLNQYNDYSVNLVFDNANFEYMSYGAPPMSIDVVDDSQFEITNRTIDKFSATASHSYSFRAVHYLYDNPDDDNDVDITYFDPSPGAQHHDPFTPELISKFSIEMNKVSFESASFVVGGLNYEQWQSFFFDASDKSTSFSSASVIKK